MTMTKKLALISLVALGTQFAVTQAYDADALKTELLSIAKYIQELRQQDKTNKLATWLESKVLDTVNTTDNDIVAMATMANKHESQIAALSKKWGYVIAYLFATALGGLASSYWYYNYYLPAKPGALWD